jgi:5-methylcytosine-specific restriction protein A
VSLHQCHSRAGHPLSADNDIGIVVSLMVAIAGQTAARRGQGARRGRARSSPPAFPSVLSSRSMTARLANPASAKDPRRTWYGLSSWKERRRHQLSKEPLCAICEAEGRVTGATIADHLPPHGGSWNAFRTGPLRSLCKPCHDALQGIKAKGYRCDIGDDGFPVDPRHPFNRGGGRAGG